MLRRPFLIAAAALAAAFASPAFAANPQVEFDTTAGKIRVELYPDAAPKTVANFLDYVKAKHYDGTQFHRVIPGFMIQGGGFTPDMQQKSGRAPIQNEANNGLKNKRGTLSMARTNDINSATSQFFVNVADNDFLDNRAGSYGYAVFGKVTDGMDVVDAIVAVKTGNRGGHQDVPVTPVEVTSARRVAPAA